MNIFNCLIRLILTLSSVSLFVVIYLIHNEINIFKNCYTIQPWMTYVFYLFIPVFLTNVSVILCKLLGGGDIKKIDGIKPANNDFLFNYLAFFFIALSIENITTFWFVLFLTIVFTFVSRTSYFNPILLVCGYKMYYISLHEPKGVQILLICKERLKEPERFRPMKVKRINDFTFIKLEREKNDN